MEAAGSAKNGKRDIFNEINITPLTDIFLVLLIIMMVVAPMMQSNRGDIKPPSMRSGQKVEQSKLTVEVTKDGNFFIDSKPVSQAALVDTLKAAAPKLEEKNVVIRADKETRSGAVMKIFEAARDASYAKVTIAGEPLSGPRQDTLQHNAAEAAAS